MVVPVDDAQFIDIRVLVRAAIRLVGANAPASRIADIVVGARVLALPPELCVHWERIAYPNGPISIGVCQKCGWEREYRTPYNGTIYNNAAQKFPKIALARAEDWDE